YLNLAKEEPDRAVRISFQDGVRLSGELLKVDKGELWFNVPGLRDTLRITQTGMRSIVMLSRLSTPVTQRELAGKLELDGVQLVGHLVDGTETGDSSCLVWQARGSATSSALRIGVSGRIV